MTRDFLQSWVTQVLNMLLLHEQQTVTAQRIKSFLLLSVGPLQLFPLIRDVNHNLLDSHINNL